MASLSASATSWCPTSAVRWSTPSTRAERVFVLVITGPSGVGKGTLIAALRARQPELELSVSATTRAPRSGETNGLEYHFLTDEQFEERLARDEFLEHATYAGNRYGTLRSELERDAPGLILEIELEGARQVASSLPSATRVFIAPPSVEALRRRLVGRGADSPEQIESRLTRAEEELAAQEEFLYVVVNDEVERATGELEDLVAKVKDQQQRST